MSYEGLSPLYLRNMGLTYNMPDPICMSELIKRLSWYKESFGSPVSLRPRLRLKSQELQQCEFKARQLLRTVDQSNAFLRNSTPNFVRLTQARGQR